MKLTSSAFEHNGDIPLKYSCDGENINPPLVISETFKGVKSFVLIVDDPDATGGGTFDHWIMWNIPTNIKEIEEGNIPEGASQGENDFGNNNYGGPCPPQGATKHRYMFKLYALDTELDLPNSSKKEEVERAMVGHVLSQTTLIGLYARQ